MIWAALLGFLGGALVMAVVSAIRLAVCQRQLWHHAQSSGFLAGVRHERLAHDQAELKREWRAATRGAVDYPPMVARDPDGKLVEVRFTQTVRRVFVP